ncbi:WD40 repeat-like protein [Exidia glandulosa HHB12029]|uniref:WD40 repeat-like protein n=1 Tax=Exidia glandulosa HHB12029 TaxID=1314781 RepID=A0A165BCU8_EXIGL|nr:WD40 repeat-like protein [Exidia glandulosa HHB12029]
MSANAQHDQHDEEGEEIVAEYYLDENDVLQEVPQGDDVPMDDDDNDNEDGQFELHGDEDDIVTEDNSIQSFPVHVKSVFAVSVHPRLPIAASGGEDDLGYLWNIEDGEQIVKLTGHTDSVSATAFSADGELIATGGMDGKVRIWRRVAKDESYKAWEFLTELPGPDEVMWLRWHPRGAVLLAGSNDGMVWLWQLPSGQTMQVFAGHTEPVHAGNFTPDGKRIVTASSDGTLILWDPRQSAPVWKLTPQDGRFAMEGGITSLAINSTSTLAVVGGADGGIRVVNLLKGDLVGALEGHAQGESVEAVEFIELTGAGVGSNVVVTGGTDGKACIWDLSTMRLRSTLEHKDAITKLFAHPQPNSHLLTTASADRTLRTWDARTGTLLKEHGGHNGPINDAAIALGGARLVSAGDDGVCLVFDCTV